MSAFRISLIVSVLLLAEAFPACAQNSPDAAPPLSRDASFLPSAASSAPTPITGFSGLATPPPPAPVVEASPTNAPALIPPAVSVTPLANVSPESIGTQITNGLGADMWKGTPRNVANRLIAMASLTTSPVLNDLGRRLLATSAIPPEGDADQTQSLTSLRVQKLIDFGDSASAWMLATRADAKLIDDDTFHMAAENTLASDSSLCPQLSDFSKARPKTDWQKALVICQLDTKDGKAAAQVGLDVMRAQPTRDDIFLQIVDKNILGDVKTLPHQLTPLTPSLLAAMRLSKLPAPGEVYGHPENGLIPALLLLPSKEDIAQLGLAERATQRGLISPSSLATIYKSVGFTPDKLTSPLVASESGSRQRALLYQAASAENDGFKRISYLVKFVQTASPDLLNGFAPALAAVLNEPKADSAQIGNALIIAQIYMAANRGDVALEWYKLLRSKDVNWDDLQILWPQFVLAGLETEGDFTNDLHRWVESSLKQSDAKADMRPARERVASALLLLDAAGFKIPEEVWAGLLVPQSLEKHYTLSPLLVHRVRAAANDNHRAETVLTAISAAGESDISIPAAEAITHALCQVGLKSEGALFAQQEIALLNKPN